MPGEAAALFLSACFWSLLSTKRALGMAPPRGPVPKNRWPSREMGHGTLFGDAAGMGQEREASAKCFSSKGQKGGCLS